MSERYPTPYVGTPPPGVPEYYPPEYPPAEPTQRSGLDMRGMLRMVRRNLWLMLAGGLIGLAVGIYIAGRQRPEYRATAVVQLTDPNRAIAGSMSAAERFYASPSIGGADPFATHFELLRSNAVLGDVVDELGMRFAPVEDNPLPAGTIRTASLDEDLPNGDTLVVSFSPTGFEASFRGASARGAYGDTVQLAGASIWVPEQPPVDRGAWVLRSRSAAVNSIVRSLEARRRGSTDIVDVRYVSHHPVEAALVVNAAVQSFQRHDVMTARQQIELRKQFVEEQLHITDSLLEEAQAALSEFNRRNRLESTRSRIEAYESQRVSLEMQRIQLRNERAHYQSLLEQFEAADPGVSEELEVLVTAQGIMSHPMVSAQFNQLMTYVNQRRDLTTGQSARSASDPEVERLDTLIVLAHQAMVRALRSYIQGMDQQEQFLLSLERSGVERAAALEPSPAVELEAQRLLQQVQMLSAQAAQYRAEQQAARIADAIEVGQVQIVDLATPPTSPLQTNRRRTMLIGLAIGLGLGLLGGILRESINTKIRSSLDAERILNVPSLAIVPRIEQRASRATRKLLPGGSSSLGNGIGKGNREVLVAHYDTRSVAAEAFRTLRTNLVLSPFAGRLRTLMVTSPTPAEGKSTVSANLAVTFAQQGVQTLLVDCDVRHPGQDSIFGVDRRPGLTDWVSARNLFSECVRKTEVDNLWLLPAGALPWNPVEFLGGERMRSALHALREKFDMVVLDVCPVLAAADPLVLGVMADGVIMVVRADRTQRAAAKQAMDKLTRVGARVAGVVVNDPDAALPRYDDYGYYEYEAYYGGEPEVQPATRRA